ncbi:DUF4123 domain-containing protein [Pseudovibrio sp. Ad26]|uniref:DUF4123 domain-containing protein n=1 Tax=Pseudovibrio sp. Ad26 TaxID=989410 RepID=UPI0007AEC5EE|nr:DUF4123 domain-containing protein [Pseudovibrio sp. Ad26]KZL15277.1 hypothetical protein PsAD26_01118 [Pseudovibrio sp. Ad26]
MTQAALSIDVEPDTLIADSVKASLFAKVTDDIAAYAIIDGQWCEDIYGRLLGDENTNWCSLIAGELAQELALTAPYLVRLEQDSDLTNWLIEEGWGKGWGIYFLASKSKAKELYRTPPPESLKQQVERGAFVASPDISEDEATDVVLLRRHFRRYLRVEFESDGRLVRFRFFDPAVLRVWLLSTNPMETQAFFGPITDFIVEDWCEEPSLCNAHQLWHFAGPAAGEHCKVGRFNMQTRQLTPMTPITESSTQTNERPKSHITLIRKAQEKAFEDMQWELYAEKVVRSLIEEKNSKNFNFLSYAEVKEFVKGELKNARSKGLEGQNEMYAFIRTMANKSNQSRKHSK